MKGTVLGFIAKLYKGTSNNLLSFGILKYPQLNSYTA